MTITPDDLISKTFNMTLRRGYDKEEVDAFLIELAEDYRTALARAGAGGAGKSSGGGDPFAAMGAEVTAVLRTAQESAEALRKKTEEEAEGIRRRAADKAIEVRKQAQDQSTSMLESAKKKADQLTQDADRYSTETRSKADREANEARGQAERYAQETRNKADREAGQVRSEADRYASDTRSKADREYQEIKIQSEREQRAILEEATKRHEALLAHERELRDRISGVERALQAVQAELGAGAPASAGKAETKAGRKPAAKAAPASDIGKQEEAVPVQQAIDEPELAPEPAPVAAATPAATEDSGENEGPWLLDMVTDDAGDKEPSK
jgi:DivIVA domain-containing protein